MFGRKNLTQEELDHCKRRWRNSCLMVTGEDGNPLNEVELISDSLMNNNGVIRGNNVLENVPSESVVKLQVGDTIRLTADDFERLAEAFFAELEPKFL